MMMRKVKPMLMKTKLRKEGRTRFVSAPERLSGIHRATHNLVKKARSRVLSELSEPS